MFDFEKQISRENTGACKLEWAPEAVRKLGYLPFTIADMEFSVPEPVKDALRTAVDHGICGYTTVDDAYFNAVSGWMKRHHDFEVKREWLTCTSGVVPALGIAVRAFTEQGDGIIIQPPVYPPFKATVELNNRTLLENQLLYHDGKYEMNFEELETLCKRDDAKLLILCSPHNPIGRVWTRDELIRVGEICKANNVLVLCDEIHSDVVHSGGKHTMFATLPGMAEMCVTCTAMSKTFNLAGLSCSNIFIPNAQLHEKYAKRALTDGSNFIPFYARAATLAAYTCDEWVDALLKYVEGNFNFCYDFIEKRIPRLKCIKANGTYLLWIDCTDLGMNAEELENFMINEAKLALDEGYIFGKGGEGFERINIAEPRRELEAALIRLEKAVNSLSK